MIIIFANCKVRYSLDHDKFDSDDMAGLCEPCCFHFSANRLRIECNQAFSKYRIVNQLFSRKYSTSMNFERRVDQ